MALFRANTLFNLTVKTPTSPAAITLRSFFRNNRIPIVHSTYLRDTYNTSSNNSLLRHKSSHATSTPELTYSGTQSVQIKTEAACGVDLDVPIRDKLDLSFEDSENAYKSKTTWEVLRAYIVFLLCSSSYLVENNMKLMKLSQKVFGKRLFQLMMKATFYGHFVAGEDQVAIQPVLERMRSFGVKSILDYSVEEDISESEAAEKEMSGCVSEAGDDLTRDQPDPISPDVWTSSDRAVEEGTVKKFHAHKQFGDRRTGAAARTYFYLNEAQCEKNMEIFLRCIEAVSGVTNCTGFAAIKITALGRPQILLQLSEAISRVRAYFAEVTGKDGPMLKEHVTAGDIANKFEQAHMKDNIKVQEWLKKMTYDETGLIHVLPWDKVIDPDSNLSDLFKVPDLKTGELKPIINPMTNREEEMFRNMMRRVHKILQAAKDLDSRVMIDAEQTYFQPAISRIAMEMMTKYNKEKAIAFNTYQCYLKETFQNLVLDLELAERQKFFFGAKLVRGAYMEQERERAKELGYEDPVNETYEKTSESYERCLWECLKRIRSLKDIDEPKRIAVMVASHNEESVRFTIQKMKEMDIAQADKVVCFGQLYGMCDQISFLLGQAGYSVYKYVPYGPVGEVLPYLSRRANENKGIMKKLQKERRLLITELRRRVLRCQFFYTPKGHYHPV